VSASEQTVAVIIPAKDAADSLPRALESVSTQTYKSIIEVIVAAADDATAEAAAGATVVRNPSGATPVGLNLAFSASTAQVIVRCDAHVALPPGYVSRAVSTLSRTGAQNVGGMQVPVGETTWERVIAAAMSSRLGAGDARYRVGGEEGPAETVYLGAFPRRALEDAGGYDEAFSRTQDYELNHRLIASGGTVWFDPRLRVAYRPRGSLAGLATQYSRYGRAKARFQRKHSGSLRLRQVAPPVVTALLILSLAGGFWFRPLWAVPGSYAATLLAWSVFERCDLGAERLLKPLALATMHLSWGTGFLSYRMRAGSRR